MTLFVSISTIPSAKSFSDYIKIFFALNPIIDLFSEIIEPLGDFVERYGKPLHFLSVFLQPLILKIVLPDSWFFRFETNCCCDKTSDPGNASQRGQYEFLECPSPRR